MTLISANTAARLLFAALPVIPFYAHAGEGFALGSLRSMAAGALPEVRPILFPAPALAGMLASVQGKEFVIKDMFGTHRGAWYEIKERDNTIVFIDDQKQWLWTLDTKTNLFERSLGFKFPARLSLAVNAGFVKLDKEANVLEIGFEGLQLRLPGGDLSFTTFKPGKLRDAYPRALVDEKAGNVYGLTHSGRIEPAIIHLGGDLVQSFDAEGGWVITSGERIIFQHIPAYAGDLPKKLPESVNQDTAELTKSLAEVFRSANVDGTLAYVEIVEDIKLHGVTRRGIFFKYRHLIGCDQKGGYSGEGHDYLFVPGLVDGYPLRIKVFSPSHKRSLGKLDLEKYAEAKTGKEKFTFQLEAGHDENGRDIESWQETHYTLDFGKERGPGRLKTEIENIPELDKPLEGGLDNILLWPVAFALEGPAAIIHIAAALLIEWALEAHRETGTSLNLMLPKSRSDDKVADPVLRSLAHFGEDLKSGIWRYSGCPNQE